MTEFEPGAINVERQRRHSAEFQSSSFHVPIPVHHVQRRNSAEFQSSSSHVSIPVHHTQRRNSADFTENQYIAQQPSTAFDELAWRTHQEIIAMQQRGIEQLQAHQQWAANQWHQHANMFLPISTQLTAPSLVVYHPPVTTYVQKQEFRQRTQYNQAYAYPYF